MTERTDYSEYLVVIRAYGDGETNAGKRIETLRCNRMETAKGIAEWLEKDRETEVRIFSDPPKIGQ